MADPLIRLRASRREWETQSHYWCALETSNFGLRILRKTQLEIRLPCTTIAPSKTVKLLSLIAFVSLFRTINIIVLRGPRPTRHNNNKLQKGRKSENGKINNFPYAFSGNFSRSLSSLLKSELKPTNFELLRWNPLCWRLCALITDKTNAESDGFHAFKTKIAERIRLQHEKDISTNTSKGWS